MSEIDKMIETDIVNAKKVLSYEITKFVRGEEDAILAQNMSENLFTQGGDDAPVVEIAKTEFPMGICDLLNKSGLAPSKSEARRLIQGGAISFKNEKVTDFTMMLDAEMCQDALLKKGKKSFIKIQVK